MSLINLSWAADGNVDSYSVYRSEMPMNVNSLPTPQATGIATKSYSDATVVVGTTYYYRVASVVAGGIKVSDEIQVLADAPTGDIYFANVVSLNHFDGANGDASSTDIKAGVSWVLNATRLSNDQSKFGITSLKGNKSRADITLPSEIGAGDFTIEFWVYPTSTSVEYFFSTPYVWGAWFAIGFDGAQKKFITFLAGGGQRVSIETFDLNTWHHVAIVKTAGYSKFYVNGLNITDSTEPDTKNYPHTMLHIAGTSTSISSSGDWFSGYIDEFRYTHGVARYTENFTPPTIAFPDS